jgi:UDP-glucose 4-epimerase
MRVAVTGGNGKLGRFVVERLRESGHHVEVLDVAGQRTADFVPVDLTDFGQVVDVLLGTEEHGEPVEAIVHLGAIPAPGLAPNAHTFANNMVSSFNVINAATRLGIRNIVWASSETVLGLPFDIDPPYAPVDEKYHPPPESTYSLVKTMEEEMLSQFCRWHPDLKVAALRFSNVIDPAEYSGWDAHQGDAMMRKWNLWGYIDARDGAQAVERALAADFTGLDTFIIAAADTVMNRDSADLLAEVFPDVELTRPVSGRETLLAIDHAREVLGFEPEHSWRD